jgi:hypothetical protein
VSLSSLALADGAVRYWPLQGSLADSIGSDDLSATGGPSFTTAGPAGSQALEFNGVDQYANTNVTGTTPNMNDPTVSLAHLFRMGSKHARWAVGRVHWNTLPNIEPGDATMTTLRTTTVQPGDNSLLTWHENDNNSVRGYRSGAFRGVSAGGLSDGKWHITHHTYDGTNYRIYVDGGLEATTAAPLIVSTNPTYVVVGANYRPAVGALQFFRGAIAHVAVYDVVLSGTQCSDQYDAFAAGDL